MRHLFFDTRREDLLSRIPALFAYISFNEDGTTTLHSATDSYEGCYGKVVENIAMPCGVNLCTYVPIDPSQAPNEYQWNSFNTFEIGTVVENKFDIVESEYIRRVKERYYQETLFDESVEYTEMDEIPEDVTSDDPEWVMIPRRDKTGELVICDGEQVFDYYEKKTVYNYFIKKCIIEEGETYTYRTLIAFYYKYREFMDTSHPFIAFMERGIGKVYTDKERLGLTDEEKYPGVPNYVYLGLVQVILTKYRHYQKLVHYYTTHYINIGQENTYLKRKSMEYELIGGDKFTRWLEKLSETANTVADEYLCYANNRSHDLTVDYSIPLFQSANDLGYLSSYMNIFTPGERYYHGELVTYEGRTYICILNRYVENGSEGYEYVRCNDRIYKRAGGVYIDITDSCTLRSEGYWSTEENRYLPVTEFTTGLWNDDLETTDFDNEHFVLLSEYVSNDSLQLSIPDKISLPDNNEWYYQDNKYGNKFKIFVDKPNIPQEFVYEYVRVNGTFYKWDGETDSYIPDPNSCELYTISGFADSQLKSLRGYQDYFDGMNNYGEPDDGEDWLFYYRIGNTAAVRLETDQFNNIKRFSGEPLSESDRGNYVYDLMAYGTYLINIECDIEHKQLKFTYVVNGHLKAKLEDVDYDVDGNRLYLYGDFEYDDLDTHGVVYTEVYNYDDEMIDELYNHTSTVDNISDFILLVNNRTDEIEDYMQKYGYEKFVFKTGELVTTMQYMDTEYQYNFIRSDYVEEVENNLDYVYTPLFKKDYFVGYSYEPTVKPDVAITRGNGAAFEMHIKLSEVKTFEDMENYSNGGFYINVP